MKLALSPHVQSPLALANAASSMTVLGPTVVADARPKCTLARASSRLPALGWIAGHAWSVALLYICLDVVAWTVLYGVVGLIRHAAFSTTPFQFLLINLIELGVIAQALYIIGGYDRKIDQQSLAYAAEHILAIGAAAALSAMLIYSVATFDQTMKPSRGALLLTFLTFLPISLLYRRWIRTYVAATFANETFLVVGSGEEAVRFYESYKNSPNRQQVDFVDLGNERVGSPIAGQGSPIVQGDLAGKLENPSGVYSGIILAERAKLSTELLERLIRTQFQQVRVYTLESFYETHWRYVPLEAIDPVWPLQSGFQLARISPYHYLKRLFDLVAATLALFVCSPLFALFAFLIWLESGRPIVFRQQRELPVRRAIHDVQFRTWEVCHEERVTFTRDTMIRASCVGRSRASASG
jgi:hypothetical protein